MNLFAIALAIAAMLTAIWPQWIELVFRVDPDEGSGALEWGLVALFAALAVMALLLARRAPRQRAMHRRRP
jgi:hypothetical protein